MTTILIKKKDTAGAPAAGDLTNAAGGAEIAVNTATKRLYTKDSGGTVVELGTNPSALTTNLLFSPDATYDIGATGANRPRDLFLSRNLTVGGTLTLTGGVNLNGNVTVGDASTDTLTINSTITSNLIFTDNTYDIGATGATRPRDLYLAGAATIGGALTVNTTALVSSGTNNIGINTASPLTNGATYGTLTINGSNGGAIQFATAGVSIAQVYNDGNSLFINPATGKTLALQIAGSTVGSISSTGLAVTGTLSATGNVTLGDASTDTLNVGNGGLIKDADGNLGVGTTATNIATYRVLAVGVGSAQGGILQFQGAAGADGAHIRMDRSGSTITGFNIETRSGSNAPISLITNGVTAVTINTSQNVGIGETTPTAKLHIGVASAGVNGTKGVRITNPAGTIVMLECGSGGDSFVGTESGSDFNIRTNNAIVATFLGGGNVGIGETNPTQRLHIKGSSTTYALAETTGTGTSSGFRMKAGAGTDFTLFTTEGGNQFGIYNNTTSAQPLTINANGALALLGGSTSATGVGITFPATQSASSNANTLDDYEEGTFTPALPAGSTGVSYTYQAGKYTKIGNVVYIHVAVRISAVTSVPGGAGSEFLGGLPFTSVSGGTNYPKLSTQWNGCDWGGTVGVAQVNPSSTAITGTGCTNNAGFVDSLPSSIWDSANNWVTVTGFYYVS
jgi:hypothetical protein